MLFISVEHGFEFAFGDHVVMPVAPDELADPVKRFVLFPKLRQLRGERLPQDSSRGTPRVLAARVNVLLLGPGEIEQRRLDAVALAPP